MGLRAQGHYALKRPAGALGSQLPSIKKIIVFVKAPITVHGSPAREARQAGRMWVMLSHLAPRMNEKGLTRLQGSCWGISD
ncbi:hypothetical protein E2C01_097826 [Portunus trituberculatus]|uniref:Uncharacterized protein n=1 Tax=Portunus trituberculatus TaxID=210409 RepID=A0A5B7KCE0_PORTR|nr:hypothetical protein [Portunus trituberculatus]